MVTTRAGTIGALLICGALAVSMLCLRPAGADGPKTQSRKQYWATSLARTIDETVLQGLYDAVARGEVGWLDVDPKHSLPALKPGINLILYHVGGNCYIKKDDCDRFPDSQSTDDQWGDTERSIDLEDPEVRKIVIDDLVGIVRFGDEVAPAGSIVGVHLDNVHRISPQGLADVFNEFLAAVETARREGRISKTRKVGYVAKNVPQKFNEALEKGLLDAPPLYQINENARLDQDGILNRRSLDAAEIGRRCSIPVFLKTFGTDVAYKQGADGDGDDVYVSPAMATQMAQIPKISGVAWSADEESYRPTLFVQGSAVPAEPLEPDRCGGPRAKR